MKLFFLSITAWLGSILLFLSLIAVGKRPDVAIVLVVIGVLMTVAPFLGGLRITVKPKKLIEQMDPPERPIFSVKEEKNTEEHPVDPYQLSHDVNSRINPIYHVEWTIIYGDGTARQTERTISDISVQDDNTIFAYCDLQEKRRKFNLSQITELFDEDTSEVVKKNIPTWVQKKLARLAIHQSPQDSLSKS